MKTSTKIWIAVIVVAIIGAVSYYFYNKNNSTPAVTGTVPVIKNVSETPVLAPPTTETR